MRKKQDFLGVFESWWQIKGSQPIKMNAKSFPIPVILLILLIFAGGSVRAATQRVTAIVHVNLVPMTAEAVIPDQTVVVKGTRIAAVGPADRITVPDGATAIDGANLYLMPGLADMHMHTDMCWLSGGWPVSPLHLYLAAGVTTVRDFGPRGVPSDYALFWRDAIQCGRLQGPNIYAAGPILYGPVDDAVKIVEEQKKQGFDFIKPYSFLSPKEFADAVKTAQHLDLYVAGHIPFAVGLDGIIAAGMDEIAHVEELDFELLNFDRTRTLGHAAWFRYLLDVASEQMMPLSDLPVGELKSRYQADIDNIIQKLTVLQIPLCTTLTVGDIILKKLFYADCLASRSTSQFLPYGFFETLSQGKNRHQIQFRGHEDFAPFHFTLNQLLLRELHAAGVTLVLGTDAGPMGMGLVPGFAVHDELKILVENGLTPYAAIRTATVNAARVVDRMTGKGDFGTLEANKRADLVLLDANPLETIDALEKIQGVMAAGRWFDKAALQQMIAPGIPVTGSVRHVCQADRSHAACFEVIIGKAFAGHLPEAIDAITVSGPDGPLPIEKNDFTFFPRIRDFRIKVPGRPQPGTYTFAVKGGQQIGFAVDIQGAVKTLPLPEAGSFSPMEGGTLSSDAPVFSWKAVQPAAPVYYRLEISTFSGDRVYSTAYVKGMQSHAVPSDLLLPGRSYRWRVRVTDNNSWQTVQNRSQSAWQTFHAK